MCFFLCVYEGGWAPPSWSLLSVTFPCSTLTPKVAVALVSEFGTTWLFLCWWGSEVERSGYTCQCLAGLRPSFSPQTFTIIPPALPNTHTGHISCLIAPPFPLSTLFVAPLEIGIWFTVYNERRGLNSEVLNSPWKLPSTAILLVAIIADLTIIGPYQALRAAVW